MLPAHLVGAELSVAVDSAAPAVFTAEPEPMPEAGPTEQALVDMATRSAAAHTATPRPPMRRMRLLRFRRMRRRAISPASIWGTFREAPPCGVRASLPTR